MAGNLISLFDKKENKKVITNFKNNKKVSFSGAGNFASKCFIISDILRSNEEVKTGLWIVNDINEQNNIYKAMDRWSDSSVYLFDLPDPNSPNPDDEINKKVKIMELLSKIINEEKVIILSTYENLLVETPTLEEIEDNLIIIKKKSSRKIMSVFEELIKKGYEVSEDSILKKGQYKRQGGVLSVFPLNYNYPVKIEADFDDLGEMIMYDQETGKELLKIEDLIIFPFNAPFLRGSIFNFFKNSSLIIEDEVEVTDDIYDNWDEMYTKKNKNTYHITFTPFLEEGRGHQSLHYFSVLKYHTLIDLTNDLKEKKKSGWKTVVFTKHFDEFTRVLKEKNIFHSKQGDGILEEGELMVYQIDKDEVLPYSFQNPYSKITVITDREISTFKEANIKRKAASHKVYLDFLTSLKVNDYVVHQDHGIAKFQGLVKKTVNKVTREYLKLAYAENDKLFVPIDQADKVNKFIGDGDQKPKLTRLGSSEWSTITNRVKKETQKIAKELLQLYAIRESAIGLKFNIDSTRQEQFERTFPYEETPGQIRSIMDVKKDMEREKPMDRLVCGDVGFGKTEVAMRAAFKAVENGKQVAFISPITILADQHYKSFTKRMDEFNIRVEMLSRFKTKKEQEVIVKKLARGKVDIIIGTHRLIQADIKFKNLGLVIIDEEQRFGVRQKEKFKEMRTEIDILTLTATPIPRTLNISLNKLRDISTITTPPPGRLPIITEVRRYSPELIREVILRETERGGQVYFLHNRVQTIEGMAEKLRALVPEARFIVCHGKLSPAELEKRIMAFKKAEFNVLISSTIIENGIDLSNANTLIVNNAEKFGLAQLYQLRGRVGRSKKQAYAYLLYQAQRLKYDAKKRLRAIVEASELGSGFQIAMKDLEIRGAGDILGANQHGAINVVGVSHFIRMLNKAVEEMKEGRMSKDTDDQPIEVTIELPLTSFIPDSYIVNSKEKINVYQKLASADSLKYLGELEEELIEDYGKAPVEVSNLFKILQLKIYAKKASLINIKAENIHDVEEREIILHMSKTVKPENIVNMLAYNQKWIISGTKLKIKSKQLGVNWYEELKRCVKILGEKVDRKKLKNKK